MREYLWELIAMAVVCGICTRLAPGGEGGFGRPMRLMCGVCLALTLLSPWRTLAEGGLHPGEALLNLIDAAQRESEKEQASPDMSYATVDGNLAAYQIRRALCDEFALDPAQVSLRVQLSERMDAVTLVRIGLSGDAIWCDSHALEAWVRQTLGCEAVVYIE